MRFDWLGLALQDRAWATSVVEAEASGDADAELRLLQSIPKLAGALESADQDTLNCFVDYALKRRFGWSEVSREAGLRSRGVGLDG